jgi:hypothetical protein
MEAKIMKNKNLLSKLMVVACAFGLATTSQVSRAMDPEAALAGTVILLEAYKHKDEIKDYAAAMAAIRTPEFHALIKSLAEEFTAEYDTYKNNGLLNKGISAATTYLWLGNNRKKLLQAAAMMGNSNTPIFTLLVARKLVTELDPLIKDGPMRKKLDAAKAGLWVHDHKAELTAVANGTACEFPEKLAQECVTVLSPLVPKEELEKNLNQAKKAFWVRKHKNSLIGAAVAGSVLGLAAAFGAGYYMGSGSTVKAA